MKNKAREFAIRYHGSQMYGDQPYSSHLDKVAAICHPYGEIAETIAYLHDVLEDTNATKAILSSEFSPFIADCVSAITDEPGTNRKEKKQNPTKSYLP